MPADLQPPRQFPGVALSCIVPGLGYRTHRLMLVRRRTNTYGYPFIGLCLIAPLCRAMPFDVFQATFRPSHPLLHGSRPFGSMEWSWFRLRPYRTLLGQASRAPVGIHSVPASAHGLSISPPFFSEQSLAPKLFFNAFLFRLLLFSICFCCVRVVPIGTGVRTTSAQSGIPRSRSGPPAKTTIPARWR